MYLKGSLDTFSDNSLLDTFHVDKSIRHKFGVKYFSADLSGFEAVKSTRRYKEYLFEYMCLQKTFRDT